MIERPYNPLKKSKDAIQQGGKLCERKNIRRLVMPFVCLILICLATWVSFPALNNKYKLPIHESAACINLPIDSKDTTIFVITPTNKRPERLADMTRLSQTLMHVPDIVWIVVEDDEQKAAPVEQLLKRSGIPYVYLNTVTAGGLPKRGWTHRNFAMDYLRKTYRDYPRNAVVYFADDDNSYDVRVFNDYIRNVETIGIWAVGLSGGAKVEAPYVEDGIITKWEAVYGPDRAYAVDMAGFAVNLKLILNSSASFGKQCIGYDPEDCFLKQFKIPKESAQAFGWDSKPKEILVWHTKTSASSAQGGEHGYVFEVKPEPKKTTCKPNTPCTNNT